MENILIQLITSFLGSLGFAILFRVAPKYLLTASLGGVLSWGAYRLGIRSGLNIFMATLIASAFSALYAEILARLRKAPAVLFFLPSVIPLVPGSNLYYAVNAMAVQNWEAARLNAILLLEYTLGIAIGISIVWAFQSIERSVSGNRT